MILVLLSVATVAPLAATSAFDLADLDHRRAPERNVIERPHPRYFSPEFEEDQADEDAIRFKLRWRRIKMTMPLPSF